MRDKLSQGMSDVLKRNESQENNVSPRGMESPSKVASKYKQLHDKWLQMKENGVATTGNATISSQSDQRKQL
jgi:hypothetical protein